MPGFAGQCLPILSRFMSWTFFAHLLPLTILMDLERNASVSYRFNEPLQHITGLRDDGEDSDEEREYIKGYL